MVRARIEKTGTIHCVWFNTWQFSQFSGRNNLSLSLIDALVEDFGIENGETAVKMRGAINQIGELVRNVGTMALVAGTEIVAGSYTARKIGEAINKDIKDDKGDSSGGGKDPDSELKAINKTIATLKKRFQECVDAAVKQKNVDRILVFIDDLDRLEPLRAVELLEVMKVFLDCEKCVFILAIDYDVVVSGVQSKYGADFNMDKGKSFFDKIIQVPFKMPVAQYDITGFVKKTLEDIADIKCSGKEIKTYVSLINTSIGSNPRSMKRLFNSYLLLLNVVDVKVFGDDDSYKKSLFALLCMQQRFENLYNYIVANIEDLDFGFFERLASTDNPEALLRQYICAEGAEAEAIQVFMKHFINVLDSNARPGMDDDDVSKLRELLDCSSVISTETLNKSPAAQCAYTYKGENYQTAGSRMSLGRLALRLIQDYVKEAGLAEKAARGFVEMINENIYGYDRKLLKTLIYRTEPALKKHTKLYFTKKSEIIRFGETEAVASNSWSAEGVETLIGLLGYGDRVTAHDEGE